MSKTKKIDYIIGATLDGLIVCTHYIELFTNKNKRK